MTNPSATVPQPDEPVKPHRVMQTTIGEELRQRYAGPQQFPHQLLVLMMELKEREQSAKNRPGAVRRKRKRASRSRG